MPDDDLLARIERLEEDNRRLSELVGKLSAPDTPEPDDGPVNRRGLLKRTAAVALGVTAATAAGQVLGAAPAAAADGQPVLLGTSNSSSNPTSCSANVYYGPALASHNAADGGRGFLATGTLAGVHGVGQEVAGVLGSFPSAPVGMSYYRAGVAGEGTGVPGVLGRSDSQAGVVGRGGYAGVHGECSNDTGYAVAGMGTSERATGVGGFSDRGIGVEGRSDYGNGVVGTCYRASDTRRTAGVYGVIEEQSYLGLDMIRAAAVTGDSLNHIGVQGVSANGNGVVGTSESARGGVFSGAAAAMRLSPGARATPPAAGETGDLYVDSTGRLWYCRQGGGTANWVTLAG